MNVFERLFKIKERGSSFFNEIVGGLIIFISMMYILPTNASILSDPNGIGMSQEGVFFITAIVSCVCCLMMGFIANFPITLSAGMGLNAFLAYTVGAAMGFSWQEAMVLLFISGIIFFVFSLTPIRKLIINKIPLNIKYIISAGLGAFICFVGLRGGGSGIINLNNTIPELGSLAERHIIIPLIGVFIIVCLMFVKKIPFLSKMAIPIGVIFCACLSLLINYCVYNGNNVLLASFSGTWGVNVESVKEILFFGTLDSNNESFAVIIQNVFSNPGSYIAIFSLIFVNLFDTTATMLAVGRDSGLIDSNGELKNARRAILADATGALICAPFGTSTITSFAESSVGVSFGAKTGLTAIVVGIMFLLTGFLYPIFSIFSSWSVSAPALICVGGLIFANNLKQLDWHDLRYAIVAFFSIIFMILTYSISTGLGIGIILFVLINLVSGKHKENNLVLYIISLLFVLSFVLNEVIKHL